MQFDFKNFIIINFIIVKCGYLFIRVFTSECENWATENRYDDCTKTGRIVHCFGNIRISQTLNQGKIEEVILCGWQDVFNPQKDLWHFPKLRVLRIEHSSNLSDIPNDFPENFHLENINISWTNLQTIRPSVFSKLHRLKYLDLRWNKLEHMDPLILPKTFDQLYLDGNLWNCSDQSTIWILNTKSGLHVADREILQCFDKKYENKHLLTVMHYKLALDISCLHFELKNCTCTMHYLGHNETGILTPHYTIDCSNKNLIRFPSFVPKNTTIFIGNNNQISDLMPLRHNIHYYNILDVLLDNNKIQNIDALESGHWLRQFRVLSLRGNFLSKLPIYILNNALERNKNAINLQLSQNPWRCECKFTMRFRATLMKFEGIIKDAANVTCIIEDTDNRKVKVLEVERQEVCKFTNVSNAQPLHLLNGILLALIIFIFIKLLYDYYRYRKYGKLPWIVSKIL